MVDCPPGQTEPCYSGASSTEGVGECRGGLRTCHDGRWSTCEGEVTPRDEDPCNLRDENCDGSNDESMSDCNLGQLGGRCGTESTRLETTSIRNFSGSLTGGCTIARDPGLYDGKAAFVHGSRAVVRMIPGIPSSDNEVSLEGFVPTYVSLQPGTSLNAVHFAVQDGMDSRIDGDRNRKVRGIVDGMVQDHFGFRWVSTEQPALYRLSGGNLVTLEGEVSPALTLPHATGGLTVDDRGYVWTGSNPSLRIEPHGVTWEEVSHSSTGRPFAYAGEVWFAGNPVHAISMEPPFVERRVEGFSAEVVRATLGYVFALSEGEVYEIDPVTLSTRRQPVPEGFGPVGALTSDGTGRFVALDGTKNIAIYDVTIGRWAVRNWSGSDDGFRDDPDLIDGTRDVPAWGMAAQEVELDRDPITLDWYQETPGKSRVEVHVRFAESRDALPASRTTCLFTEPPADLTECHKGKRYARVEIMLLPDGDDRPKIGEVTWFGYK